MGYADWQQFRAEHLEQMLQSGEHILWQGKPVKPKYVVRKWPMSCFGAFFLGFAIFWTIQAFLMTREIPAEAGGMGMMFRYFFPLFGVPFIIVGAALTFGHFIFSGMSWKNMEYAITNQRVLIRSGARTISVSSTELEDVTGVTVTGTEVGKVTFNVVGAPSGYAPGQTNPQAGVRVPGAPAFECIRQPQDVYRIAEDALHKLRRDK